MQSASLVAEVSPAPPAPVELDRLASRLGLTAMQRAFADALASDPRRNQTHAAIAAGVERNRAHIAGSRWARNGKVIAYLAEIERAARHSARKTVMRRADILRGLADQASGTVPTKRRVKRNGKGNLVSTVEEYDSLRAHVRLLDHSEWREKGPAGGTINVWLQAVQAARQAPALAAASVDALAIDAEIVAPADKPAE